MTRCQICPTVFVNQEWTFGVWLLDTRKMSYPRNTDSPFLTQRPLVLQSWLLILARIFVFSCSWGLQSPRRSHPSIFYFSKCFWLGILLSRFVLHLFSYSCCNLFFIFRMKNLKSLLRHLLTRFRCDCWIILLAKRLAPYTWVHLLIYFFLIFC